MQCSTTAVSRQSSCEREGPRDPENRGLEERVARIVLTRTASEIDHASSIPPITRRRSQPASFLLTKKRLPFLLHFGLLHLGSLHPVLAHRLLDLIHRAVVLVSQLGDD
jgi:hypothetical protein